MALLDVKNLCVDFHTDQGTVHAVRDISFSVGESEAVGIVGESGSGKSYVGKLTTSIFNSSPIILVNSKNVWSFP